MKWWDEMFPSWSPYLKKSINLKIPKICIYIYAKATVMMLFPWLLLGGVLRGVAWAPARDLRRRIFRSRCRLGEANVGSQSSSSSSSSSTSSGNNQLGGGNSNILGIFTPKIGEDEPNLTCAHQRFGGGFAQTFWEFSPTEKLGEDDETPNLMCVKRAPPTSWKVGEFITVW